MRPLGEHETQICNPDVAPAERILVVDDSKGQRRYLALLLARWGYSVLEAENGAQALQIAESENVDLIISDWMMPGMSGLDLCQKIRNTRQEKYIYFILLTSKSEKPAVARGLDVGADDFLTKPVPPEELHARIRAGERILRMDRQLREKNREIRESLRKIAALYDALDHDLAEARKLQQSLVQDNQREFGPMQVSLLLQASGHVGGDLVGCFHVDEKKVGIFAIDVSGHGVASALLTARLAGLLSSPDPGQNIALTRGIHGKVCMLSPAEAAQRLNRLYFKDIRADQYFTMILAEVDSVSRSVRMALCGHPRPMIQRSDGSIKFIEGSGMPIGLFEDAEWDDIELTIPKGGRLLLTSDGMTECATPDGELLDETGLSCLLKRNRDIRGLDLFDALMWDLNLHSQDHDLDDDVSGVLVEFGRKLAG